MLKQIIKRNHRHIIFFLVCFGFLLIPILGFASWIDLDHQVTRYPVNMPKILPGAIDQIMMMYDPIMVDNRSLTLGELVGDNMLSAGLEMNIANNINQYIIPININVSTFLTGMMDIFNDLTINFGVLLPIIDREIDYNMPDGFRESAAGFGDMYFRLQATYNIMDMITAGVIYGLKAPTGSENTVYQQNMANANWEGLLIPTGTGSWDSAIGFNVLFYAKELAGIDLTVITSLIGRANGIGTNTSLGYDDDAVLMEVDTHNPDSLVYFIGVEYDLAPLLGGFLPDFFGPESLINSFQFYFVYQLYKTMDNGWTMGSDYEFMYEEDQVFYTDDEIMAHDVMMGFTFVISNMINLRLGMTIPCDTYYYDFLGRNVKEYYSDVDAADVFPEGLYFIPRHSSEVTGNISVNIRL